jgi:[ribosomal protein S5]-alanine N-acetyltransferase
VAAPAPWLESERLALRRFTLDDLDTLARLNADPRVTEHLGGVKDRATSEGLLRTRILAYYDEHPGLGIWATTERATGAVTGFHVLNHIQGESHVQVGYALFTEYWGRGYATEMAVALLRYGNASLRLPQIVAITNLGNVASQHVLLKAGLERRGERLFTHPAYVDQGPMAWFESDRERWLETHIW